MSYVPLLQCSSVLIMLLYIHMDQVSKINSLSQCFSTFILSHRTFCFYIEKLSSWQTTKRKHYKMTLFSLIMILIIIYLFIYTLWVWNLENLLRCSQSWYPPDSETGSHSFESSHPSVECCKCFLDWISEIGSFQCHHISRYSSVPQSFGGKTPV